MNLPGCPLNTCVKSLLFDTFLWHHFLAMFWQSLRKRSCLSACSGFDKREDFHPTMTMTLFISSHCRVFSSMLSVEYWSATSDWRATLGQNCQIFPHYQFKHLWKRPLDEYVCHLPARQPTLANYTTIHQYVHYNYVISASSQKTNSIGDFRSPNPPELLLLGILLPGLVW